MLELIAEEGYAAASTNRIAQRAQVNIASLYQYFPNRQAIALALYERAASDLAQRVHRHLIADITLPLEQGIPRLIKTVVDFLEKEAALMHRVYEVSDLRESAQALSLENLARDNSRAYLEHHLGKLDKTTLACKLHFVQGMGMSLIRRYVLDRPAQIPKARFVAELSDLIICYLRRPLPEVVRPTRRGNGGRPRRSAHRGP